MKKYIIGVYIIAMGILPIMSLAQTAPLQPASACTDFMMNLKMSSAKSDPTTQAAILNLQLALSREGFTIAPAELGMFGKDTKDAVRAFQEKYSGDVLAPFGMKKGTGNFATITRLKMQALYGCRASGVTLPAGSSISIQVSSLVLDSNGVTATICNNGKNSLPTVPFRIRLNGINRDFEAIGAQGAGACTTDTWKYESWGLTYDPASTFTAVSILDPNAVYKTAKMQYPLNASTSIPVAVIPGYHLSVRSMLLKSTGLQATFCNLGTLDLTSFPVDVMVNGTKKSFDVAGAYVAGKCVPMNWTYDNWGITYKAGMTFNATISVDPSNTYKETNEFDNVATAVGTL